MVPDICVISVSMIPIDVMFQGESFIRKGVSGGWKKYFSQQLEEDFDKWIEKETEGTGIQFTWTV